MLVDGQPVRSCLAPLSSAVGKKITTIEGLEKGGTLHPVQQAFLHEEAFQCGYCTSGMILSAVAFLEGRTIATEEDIAKAMNGNLCRCGTYPRIVKAVRQAAAALREGSRA